jgi:hypothetical protein
VNDALPHELFAGYQLLDRQLLDRDGWFVGKVDDLELDLGVDPDGVPVVVAILSGPGALAGRIGGRAGAWIGAVHRRLHEEPDPHPARVPFELVRAIHEEIELGAGRADLESDRTERWARDVVIAKVPGARHAAE